MKKAGMILGGILLVGLGLWWYLFPSYSWHQKMTVEVNEDGQVYAGSSVVEMHVRGYPDTGYAPGVRSYGLRGEAVVVAMPDDRYLFALLTYNAFLASKVFHDKMEGSLSEPGERWAAIISKIRDRRTMVPKDYPLLVTFTDITDPKTVREVDPENLAATFGPGVSLKRITLEITDEPMTEGRIERVLGWLGDPKVMKNPGWRNLPSLSQTAIYGLRSPVRPIN